MADDEQAIGLEDAGIAKLVVKALSNHGWAAVDPATVEVTNLTQNADPHAATGGVFKVARTDSGPNPAVSLHVRPPADHVAGTASQLSPEALGKALIKERGEAISKVLADLDLGPKRLVDSKHYFIESWEGRGHPSLIAAEDFKKVGTSIAALHRETQNMGAWYDPFLAQLSANIPALRKAGESGFWQWRTGGIPFVLNNLSDQNLVAEWCQADFKFLSGASKRMVCCHCDMHILNLVVMGEGSDPPLKVIDLDSACHGWAILDLSFFLDMALCHPPPSQELLDKRVDTPGNLFRAFADAYLEGMGDPSDRKDVDDLLVDCIVGAQFFHSGLCQPKKICDFGNDAANSGVTSLGFFHAAKGILDEILANEREQKVLLAGLETLPNNAKCEGLVSLCSVYRDCELMKAKRW